jgi:hypothetical protein
MRVFNSLINLLLLVVTPIFLLFPQYNLSCHSIQHVPFGVEGQRSLLADSNLSFSYDEIIDLIDDIESGAISGRYTPEEIKKINRYIAGLAIEGALYAHPESIHALESDIVALLTPDISGFEYATPYFDTEYALMEPGELTLCKGWLSKNWDKTKEFVKDHKKEIIIGAAVVVAVTVIVVAVVVVSSAGTAAALGCSIGAGAMASSNSEGREKPGLPEESLSVAAIDEAPMLKEAVGDQVYSFKEAMFEELGLEDQSYREKAREFGAYLAHQAFEEVTELVEIVPRFCEEVKEVGARFFPESLAPAADPSMSSALENYQSLVSQGHKAIDSAFSTNQSECFTAESKALDPMNGYAIGMLPLPGGVPKLFSNATKLVENGKVLDRAGFTKAGRGLMKHGYREDSVFPKPVGNPQQVNARGQEVLESIIKHPERRITHKHTKNLGEVVDIHAPGIGGVRYNASGELIGFLEP